MFDKKYVSKDIEDIREEIIEYIKEYNPDWTDFNMSSIQMQYTDICAGVADMLLFYMDNQALECFLKSARQKKNVKSIMSSLGYSYESIGPALGVVRFDRVKHEDDSYEEGSIFIPEGTTVYADDKDVADYVTLEDAYMYEGTNSIDVNIVQGYLRKLVYSESLVRESYKLYLTESPVPLKYVKILNEGWEKVDDAYLETSGGKKYSVHLDSKDMVYIMFTYNWRNYLSEGDDKSLEIQILETLGSTGKIDAYRLGKVEKGKVVYVGTEEEASGVVNVSNPKGTYGAFDEVSLNRQKANAQNWLKTYNRIILREDFDTMVRKEPWVIDCEVYDWRRNDTVVGTPHLMKAFVTTVDGVNVDASMLTELTQRLQKVTVPMTTVVVQSADFVSIDLEVRIKLIGSTSTETVRNLVYNRLVEEYSYEEYVKGNEKTALRFQMTLNPVILSNEILRMSEAITKVELSLKDSLVLSETQFLNANISVLVM